MTQSLLLHQLSVLGITLLLQRHSALARLNYDAPSWFLCNAAVFSRRSPGSCMLLPTVQVSESWELTVLFTASSLILSMSLFLVFINLFIAGMASPARRPNPRRDATWRVGARYLATRWQAVRHRWRYQQLAYHWKCWHGDPHVSFLPERRTERSEDR